MKGKLLPLSKARRLADEAAALAASPKGRRKLAEAALKNVDLKKLKLTAFAAGGGVLLLGAAGSVYRYETFRIAVSKELKKQLAPLHEKLDALEKQNEELKKELEKQDR